jgi:hypothetical protein
MTRPLFPLQESLEWLAIAARDLRLAELALSDQPPLAGEGRPPALPGYRVPLGMSPDELGFRYLSNQLSSS